MSEMNYVDSAFVYEDVYRLARERRGEKVIINWRSHSHLGGVSPEAFERASA